MPGAKGPVWQRQLKARWFHGRAVTAAVKLDVMKVGRGRRHNGLVEPAGELTDGLMDQDQVEVAAAPVVRLREERRVDDGEIVREAQVQGKAAPSKCNGLYAPQAVPVHERIEHIQHALLAIEYAGHPVEVGEVEERDNEAAAADAAADTLRRLAGRQGGLARKLHTRRHARIGRAGISVEPGVGQGGRVDGDELLEHVDKAFKALGEDLEHGLRREAGEEPTYEAH